jgi:hypothetical protein
MQGDGVDPHNFKALIEGVRRALQRRTAQRQGGSQGKPGGCGVTSQAPRVAAIALLWPLRGLLTGDADATDASN